MFVLACIQNMHIYTAFTTTMPPILKYHSRTAPTYFSARMSGPLAYLYITQTFAPSHRAQVFT